MFKSNIRELMDKKNKTVRLLSKETELSDTTIFRATQDDTIGACQLKTKRLYEEIDEKSI